jgi:starvation-inducible DNA-binding protein
MKNNIGLDQKKSKELVDMLNDLLANYQMFYQNLRGFHWNIKGKNFFELHLKFEELYEDAVIKIDEIAERVLTLQGVPLHTFEDYLKQAEIDSFKQDKVGSESVRIVIDNFSTLIAKERAILTKAGDAEDEGTASQMSDYITETEKTLWMLNAYMS